MNIRQIASDEPARVRAAWTALIAVLAGLGITISEDIDGWVQAGILVVAAVLPILQGETTRAKVTPVSALNGVEGDDQGDPGDWINGDDWAASLPDQEVKTPEVED